MDNNERCVPKPVDFAFEASITASMDWFELEALITDYSAEQLRRVFSKANEAFGDTVSDEELKCALHKALFERMAERGEEQP